MGIPLKGRIDAKIKNSIFEIKSKESLPKDAQELIEHYPQDIEQLCFYFLLDPENPKENILITTTHSNSEEIKVFRIKILDQGKIKNLALKRIQQLNTWLDNDSISNFLFKCRYCNEDCTIKSEELCQFFENKSLPCEVKDFIEIVEVPEIKEKLNQINYPLGLTPQLAATTLRN